MQHIPFYDARENGPVEHAIHRVAQARKLRNACFAPVPGWALEALRLVDVLSLRWMRRTASPYVRDIEVMSRAMGFGGIAAINMGYQFGCTTGIAPSGTGAPLMRRVLDWPLKGLGAGLEVVHQQGPAGDFYNVTWPGAAGVLTAMAPGRFCAAINQAPMRRRTRGGLLRGLDIALNLQKTLRKQTGWPPDHLLRHVFETCPDWQSAVAMLIREPVARPVLFSLSGIVPAQSILIERTELSARLHSGPVAVANDWQTPDRDWEPRAPVKRLARKDNPARMALMREANEAGRRMLFWLDAPILNANTRLAVEMSADGELIVQGFEPVRGELEARPATKVFMLDTRLRAAA